ncbi:unnamed protein product [Cyclocybe aegerita]|uniref:Rho-GAP domain-containing protein n=1 Tax=Cyclocybe aegerita TaxID=1973307 RepID=A0A8S0WFE8_CYCAE|nr:unnamed protein product [Cyclocybe aegerita]
MLDGAVGSWSRLSNSSRGFTFPIFHPLCLGSKELTDLDAGKAARLRVELVVHCNLLLTITTAVDVAHSEDTLFFHTLEYCSFNYRPRPTLSPWGRMSQRHHVTPNTSSQPSGGPSAALLGHAPGQSSFQPSATQYMHLYAHDHPPSPSSNSTKQQQLPAVAVAAPRTSSLPLAVQMGHSQSKPAPPLPSPVANNGSPTSTLNTASSAATKGLNAAVAGGMKLKRAFAGRRKKSEDASTVFVRPSEQELKQRTVDQFPRPAETWTPQRIEVGSSSAPQFFNKPLIMSPPSSMPSPPPPTPPKKELPAPTASTLPPPDLSVPARNSVIPLSPGISSAVNYMMLEQQQQTAIKQVEGDKREMKESWRKSDSTNSHHTIRPGAGVSSSRSSRPVSWAESFQSAHTVVQVSGNKRRSALLGDADFGMPEEDDDDDDADNSSFNSSSPHPPQNPASTSSPSLPSSVPARVIKKRRSVSLVGVASTSSSKTSVPVPAPPPSASAAELKYPSYSISEGVPPPRYPTAPVPRLPPMMSPSVSQPQPPTQPATSMASATVASLKGKFAAWSSGGTLSTTTISPPIPVNFTPRRDQTLPSLPQHNLAPTPSPTTPSSRQPAISGIGPAAAGLAKRAVEKMGRKWGLSSSTSGSGSGYSSSSSTSNSTSAPSAWSTPHTDYAVIRDSAGNHSTPSLGSSFGIGGTTGFMSGSPGKGVGIHKRTPNAPSGSGAGSISSSLTSASESDPFAPVGPVLGKQLRGGLRSKNGVQVSGGIVFSRDLRSVVRETGIKVGKPPNANSTPKEGLVGELEERMLPALVVRCAQHLLIWGVQEEGLFRVNGRPSHVSKLRAEFDSGADFDMADCTPGDLDPHAVSSVFKAFLRTLPEPILTQKLQPYFDAAINKETALNAPPQPSSPNRMSLRPIPGLPSGPKAGGGMAIRKPPSLSTLAMPSFTGIPPPSKSLVAAVRSLIAQLPQENRDLIRTVVDLIRATAKQSKETKMPLSNLLLVFCPSLNMSPPLLKVLCEAEGIWSNEDSPVIDIRRHTPNLGAGDSAEVPPPTPTKNGVNTSTGSGKEVVDETSSVSDTMSGMELDEEDSLRSERPSLDNPSSDYHASAEDDGSSMYDGRDEVQRRMLLGERPEVPTLYLSTRSHCSSSSASSLLQDLPTSKYDGAFVHHLRDTATDDGSISSGPYSVKSMNNPHPSSSPPPLSSSAESITTPTSSSNPSLSDLHLDGSEKAQLEPQHQHESPHSQAASGGAPHIAEPIPLELRSQSNKSRPLISAPMPYIVPVQFPSDAPQPAVPTTPSKRRSIPILSLPNFSPPTSAHDRDSAYVEASGAGVNIERTLRAKKPSLKLLFSKRSASSLNTSESRDRDRLGSMPSILPSMMHPAPRSASDSSISTPISAVTAPQSTLSGSSSTSNLPPVLDTPIEDGSLKLDLGLGFEASSTTAMSNGKRASAARGGAGNVSTEAVIPKQTAVAGPYAPLLRTSLSQDSRRSAPSQPTSIDSRSVPKPAEKPIPLQPSLSSLSLSSTTSHRLSLFDDGGDDDWTQSVLTAAEMANQRPKS